MPTVFCGAIDCEFNNSKNKCTKKQINLSDNYVHTVNDGMQHFNKCKDYKLKNDPMVQKYYEFIGQHFGQKIGQWNTHFDTVGNKYYACSLCGATVWQTAAVCPDCQAIMQDDYYEDDE